MSALKQTVLYFQTYLKVNVGITATYEEAEDLLKTMLNEQKEQAK